MIGRSDEASVVVAGAKVVGAKVVVSVEMVAFAITLSLRCKN